jgi:hypothetical protein
VNHRLESRMRENRTSGSEGGGAGNSTSPSYPYQHLMVGRKCGWGHDAPAS